MGIDIGNGIVYVVAIKRQNEMYQKAVYCMVRPHLVDVIGQDLLMVYLGQESKEYITICIPDVKIQILQNMKIMVVEELASAKNGLARTD